jgi:ribosomal protein S18 acetylase RimI-like enzyme
MSELRPETPPRRPETARPRHGDEPTIEPPDAAELAAFERHLVGLPSHSGATVTDRPDLGATLVTGPLRGPAFEYAGAIRWDDASWRDRLGAVTREQRRIGAWPSLLVADGLTTPSSLADELLREGWTEVERETVLWVGRASIVPHLDPSLRIEAVTRRSIAAHEALERDIFGLPPAHAQLRTASLAAALGAGLRAYIVRVHEEPVAVARLSSHAGVAGLYAIGVAEQHRGQGLGTLITTVATRAALATCHRLVWLSVDERNARALRMYTRLGFRPAFGWRRLLGAD